MTHIVTDHQNLNPDTDISTSRSQCSIGYRAFYWTQVRGFKPGRSWWVFDGDKSLQHDFLRREVKPSVPCSKILRHVKDPSGVYFALKIIGISRQLPAFLLGVSAVIFQRGLVNVSGLVRTQMGSTIDQKITAVHGSLCTIPPLNNQQVNSEGFWRCISLKNYVFVLYPSSDVPMFEAAVSNGHNRVGTPLFHLMTETDSVSETLCIFRIWGYGQSSKI
jgi:hypothetical protein